MSTEPTPQSNIETLKALIQQNSADKKQQAQLISKIISSVEWNDLDDGDQQLILKKGYISDLFTWLLNPANETSQKDENGLQDNERIAAELYAHLSGNSYIWDRLPTNDQKSIIDLTTRLNNKTNFFRAVGNFNMLDKPLAPKPLTWKEWFSKWFRIVGIGSLIISVFFISKALAASIIAGSGTFIFVIGDLLTPAKDWGKQIHPTGNKIVFYLLAIVLIALGATIIGNLLQPSSVLDFVSKDSLGGLIPALVFGASFVAAGLKLFASNWAGTNAYEKSLESVLPQVSENPLSASFRASNTASAPSSNLSDHPSMVPSVSVSVSATASSTENTNQP